jgi:hypothetical protein
LLRLKFATFTGKERGFLSENLLNFVQLIETEKFGDAHEFLEKDWLKKRESREGKILKGFINGATALELRRLGRKNESEERVWKTFDKFMLLLNNTSPEEFFEIRDLIQRYRENWTRV